MKGTLGLVAAIMVFGAAAAAAADHVGTGVIVAADPGGPTVHLRLEGGRPWTLVIGYMTEISDDFGRAIPAGWLNAGDYVSEVCTRLPDGRVVAKQITVLRQARRDHESPRILN